MTRLAGKRVLITGGAGGQGASEATTFVDQGAQVVIADIDDERGGALADELGPAAHYVSLDVSSRRAWDEALARAVDLTGGLDVLINNAARYRAEAMAEATEASVDAILAVNLKGAYFGTQAVAEIMAPSGGGSIINVASTAGLVGHALHTVYGMSKAGLLGLTRASAAELSPYGIRVNALVPGAIAGQMLGASIPEARQHDSELWSSVPLRRVGEAEEVAQAAVFLASDESSYMTAAEIVVDGGATGVR